MYDKWGRYVDVREIKDMRVFKVSGVNTVFIAHKEIPIYLIIESLEETHAP